jgi:hypothetical protein
MREAIAGLVLVSLMVLTVACERDARRVFVPAASFTESIFPTTKQGRHAVVRVAEPLIVHVRRESGPWVAVHPDSLTPNACHLVRAPARIDTI